jgi:DNA-binding XRE family transcriptional regulator
VEEDQKVSRQSKRDGGIISRLLTTIDRIETEGVTVGDQPVHRSGLPRPTRDMDMYAPGNLGQQVYLLRHTAQLNQTDFGKLLGCSRRKICAIEAGTQGVPTSFLKQLEKVFGLKVQMKLEKEPDGLSLSQEFRQNLRGQDGSD